MEEKLSRRTRVDEKRKLRKGFLFMGGSVLLMALLVFFGASAAASFALVVGNLKGQKPAPSAEDKTAPGRPQLDTIANFVKEPVVTASGRAEAGSEVRVYNNEEVAEETTAQENTSFSTRLTLVPGENYIYVTVTDASGNVSEKSNTFTVIYDTEVPTIEIEVPGDGQSFSDTDRTILIKGKTEAGSKLTVNERVAVVDPSGNFTLKYTLAEGENQLLFRAQDGAQNSADKTITVSYTP
jgi:hypothetical protein